MFQQSLVLTKEDEQVRRERKRTPKDDRHRDRPSLTFLLANVLHKISRNERPGLSQPVPEYFRMEEPRERRPRLDKNRNDTIMMLDLEPHAPRWLVTRIKLITCL
jgi:hypothetical protein